MLLILCTAKPSRWIDLVLAEILTHSTTHTVTHTNTHARTHMHALACTYTNCNIGVHMTKQTMAENVV